MGLPGPSRPASSPGLVATGTECRRLGTRCRRSRRPAGREVARRPDPLAVAPGVARSLRGRYYRRRSRWVVRRRSRAWLRKSGRRIRRGSRYSGRGVARGDGPVIHAAGGDFENQRCCGSIRPVGGTTAVGSVAPGARGCRCGRGARDIGVGHRVGRPAPPGGCRGGRCAGCSARRRRHAGG